MISTSDIVSVEGSAYTGMSAQNRHPTALSIGSFVRVRSQTGDGATASTVVTAQRLEPLQAERDREVRY